INIHEQIYAWRRELVKEHETPFVKKVAMKAAGELLSRPAAYRAAVAAADVALAHLPRFVIYNGLNAWGSIVGCRIRPSRHSIAGTTPIAETSDEQPRRNFCIHPREPAEGETAASCCSTVRRALAGVAPGCLQREPGADGRNLSRSAGSWR